MEFWPEMDKTILRIFGSREKADAYNQRKRQEEADHAAGFAAGPPVDLSKNIYYQWGQIARQESEAELYYCGHCGQHRPMSHFPH